MKADQWGIPNVDAMLESLDNDQINEWMAYDRTQHNERERQTAHICYTMACLWSSGSRPKFEDFLPRKGFARDTAMSGTEVKSQLDAVRGARFK